MTWKKGCLSIQPESSKDFIHKMRTCLKFELEHLGQRVHSEGRNHKDIGHSNHGYAKLKSTLERIITQKSKATA